MHEILPYIRNLLETTLLTETTVTERLDDTSVSVESACWFIPGNECAIGDSIYTVRAADWENHTLTFYAPLDDFGAGTEIRKLRAVNMPLIYVGDYDGPLSDLPVIQVKGQTADVEPLSIGMDSFLHSVEITVLAEKETHSQTYEDMLAIASEIRTILQQIRKLDIGPGRHFYKCESFINYGTANVNSTTLAAAQIIYEMHEERHLKRPLEACREITRFVIPNMITIDEEYTVLNSDQFIWIETGGFNVNLPEAADVINQVFTFKTINDSQAVTIIPNDTDTIAGANSYTLCGEVVLCYRGCSSTLPPNSDWEILSETAGTCPEPEPCVNEYSMRFDTSANYATVYHGTGLPLYPGAYTISLWVKGSPATTKTIWAENDNPNFGPPNCFWTFADKIAAFKPSGDLTISATTVFDFTWHHVLYTDDGSGNAYLYVDGIADANDFSHTPDLTRNLNVMAFGAIPIGMTNVWMEGILDEVAAWDRVLSPEEIAEVYNSGCPTDVPTDGLIGWWRMGEDANWNGLNWFIPDASGNGNHAITTNMVEADRLTDTPCQMEEQKCSYQPQRQ